MVDVLRFVDDTAKVSAFIENANAYVGYKALTLEGADRDLTCGEAAQLLVKLVRISKATLDKTGSPYEALKFLEMLPPFDVADPAKTLSEMQALIWLRRVTCALVIVKVGESVVDRETVKLDLGAPAKLIDGQIYVPIIFGELGLGGCVHKQAPYSIIVNNKEFADQAKFVECEGTVYAPLVELCEFLDADRIEADDAKAMLFFQRIKLKSNRDLNEREDKMSFTYLYRRYWYTPLPERVDEQAWRARGGKFCTEESALPNNTLLHFKDKAKLLNPDFCDQEGWCRFDDGSAVLSVITPMPGVTAEMFYWWFAWHGLDDVRYMTWYPPSHYGIWIENGPWQKGKPFRGFDDSLDYRGKSCELLHHPLEAFFTSTMGGDDYYQGHYDGYNAIEGTKGPGGLNFIDLTAPGRGYFDPEEYNRQSDAGMIAAVGQYPPSPEFGAVMCHFFRVDKDGNGALHTHFWFGITQNPENGEILYSKTMKYWPMLVGLSEHCVREFADLADVMPDIAAREMGKDFKEFANPGSYVAGKHPDLR
ncbi:MAG: hypothetical protein IKR67_07265 [Lachnospiraceae bacterium]|nr:hypothetical protein [Lachnospiraceae bacterium]